MPPPPPQKKTYLSETNFTNELIPMNKCHIIINSSDILTEKHKQILIKKMF